MPSPTDLRKQFIKAFGKLAHHRQRHDVLNDFLDLAVCAIRKTTLPPGEPAEAIEAEYMAVVKRNAADDIRAMPELLAITALGVQDGGCDFLGQVVGELELLNSHLGQFFTPYEVLKLMAQISLENVQEFIDTKGFVALQEPACGAGGMILAAADVIAAKGYDIGQTLYVDATDISSMCWKMAYLQTSLRGIPAMIRLGDTLRLEFRDHARTPALLPFLMRHGDPFRHAAQEPIDLVAAPTATPASPRGNVQPTAFKQQLSLFDI